ncbi:hypothetical protein GOBAR_DD02950 [Gossypium barbadense]|nr:hypothetical protein GOBAR_DD02950 [Gossypium barbadense]
MVRTRERAAQEPPSAVNQRRNDFSTPPFVTIDSDESPPPPPPQPRPTRRNHSPTLIAIVYPPYEPSISDYHSPNNPNESPDSSDNHDHLSS